jgi:hypothetical protein
MNERDYPQVDTSPSEHERRVVEERDDGRTGEDDLENPNVDPGRRPTSEEDLAADMKPGA